MGELNVKSSTAEKGIDILKEFLQKLVGPAAEEIGQLMSDKVKHWRLRNQIRSMRKVQKILEQDGISPQKIDLKALYPYLEGTALEEDDDMQTLWANLLVNYIDPAKNLQVTVFPAILAQLSSEEVKILKFLPRTLDDVPSFADENIPAIIVDSTAFANVWRLGLLAPLESYMVAGLEGETTLETERKMLRKHEYAPSVFGSAFLRACER